MAEANQREAWQRMSALQALIANCNRDDKKHPAPYTPQNFDPFSAQDERKRKPLKITLKQAFDILKGANKCRPEA